MPNLIRINAIEDQPQDDIEPSNPLSNVDDDDSLFDTGMNDTDFLDTGMDNDTVSSFPDIDQLRSDFSPDIDQGLETQNENPIDQEDNSQNMIEQTPLELENDPALQDGNPNLDQSDLAQSLDSQPIDTTLDNSSMSDMEQSMSQAVPVADPATDPSAMPLEGDMEITNPDRKDLDAATKDDAMAREMEQPSVDTTISEPSDIDELDFEKEFDSGLTPDVESDMEENLPDDFAQDTNEQNSEDTVNDLQDMLSDYLDMSGEGTVSGEDIANSLRDAVDNGGMSQSDASNFVQDVANSALDGNEASSDLLETIGTQADSIFDNGLNDFLDSLDNSGLSEQGTEDVISKLTDNMSNLESSQAQFGDVTVSADSDGQAQIDNPDEVSSSSQVANDSSPDTDAVSNDTQLNQVTSELADNPDIAQNYLDGDGNVDLDALQDTVTSLVDSDPSLTNVDDGTLNTDAIQNAIESQQIANDVATGVEANIPQYDNATNDPNTNSIDTNNPWDNVDKNNNQDNNWNDMDNSDWNDFDASDFAHDFAAGE